jgi:hypothetical protein
LSDFCLMKTCLSSFIVCLPSRKCLLFTSSRCDDPPARVLPLTKPLPRESVGRGYDGHKLHRRFWRDPPASARRERCLCWPALGNVSSPQLGGTRVKVESCAGSSGAGTGTSPFLCPRTSLAADRVNLQVSGSSHLFAVVKFRFHCSFANHITASAERTAGEVLEPAYF